MPRAFAQQIHAEDAQDRDFGLWSAALQQVLGYTLTGAGNLICRMAATGLPGTHVFTRYSEVTQNGGDFEFEDPASVAGEAFEDVEVELPMTAVLGRGAIAVSTTPVDDVVHTRPISLWRTLSDARKGTPPLPNQAQAALNRAPGQAKRNNL